MYPHLEIHDTIKTLGSRGAWHLANGFGRLILADLLLHLHVTGLAETGSVRRAAPGPAPAVAPRARHDPQRGTPRLSTRVGMFGEQRLIPRSRW